MKALLLTHVVATWWMVAVIWFIQWVHYPLFASVGTEAFARYESAHVSRVTPLVMIPMIVELGTGVALALREPSLPWAWVGVALIASIWAATFFLSVPAHQALEEGFEAGAHRRLVLTNWLRTIAWTARGGLCVVWLNTLVSFP